MIKCVIIANELVVILTNILDKLYFLDIQIENIVSM